MQTMATILICFTALLHVWFMVLETFLWTKPLGLKTFTMNSEKAQITKVLAQNQGVYNGFLAAGLFWGALSGEFRISVFFLSCVIIAGIVGGITVSKKIIFVQALPATLAMLVVLSLT
jgi:putative membrane protein